MEMTNKQKAIERYFKAIGWSEATIVGYKGTYWQQSDDEDRWDVITGGDLPDIIDHYPSFKKWVLERMRKNGFTDLQIGENYIYWFTRLDYVEMSDLRGDLNKEQDDLLAAVEAATKYWESKNG